MTPWGTLTLVAKTSFCPDLCCSEESDDKLSKPKNDSAGKVIYFLIQMRTLVQALCEREQWRASSLNSLCITAADDFGSDEEENEFGEEEDEDGGSDYEEKRGKKAKKVKVEKPSKRGPKRKRAAGNNPVSFLITLNCLDTFYIESAGFFIYCGECSVEHTLLLIRIYIDTQVQSFDKEDECMEYKNITTMSRILEINFFWF